MNRPEQLSLLDDGAPTWGGLRDGAGRKVGRRTRVEHRFRSEHKRRHPVHVTFRAKRGMCSLRAQRILNVVRKVIAAAHCDEFRVAHYSIQSDHVHLLVEADDKATLSSRLRSVIIRLALRLNRLLGRKGALWGDRYHRRDLKTPREVRNALVYVLANFKKHRGYPRNASLLDPYSSAVFAQGWHPRDRPKLHAGATSPVAPPETWLLKDGWQRYGPLRADEGPRGAALM